MISQIIIIALTLTKLGYHIAKHGEQNKTKFNGWYYLIISIIYYFILYQGGFFNVFLK